MNIHLHTSKTECTIPGPLRWGSPHFSPKNLGAGSQSFHFLPPVLPPQLVSLKSSVPCQGPEGHWHSGAQPPPPGRASIRLTAIPEAPFLLPAALPWEQSRAWRDRDRVGLPCLAAPSRLRCLRSRPRGSSSGLAAPRRALRRVQLHRLPPPHLALLPVDVRLQALQHRQALRQALGGGEQQVVVEERAQDGADQGPDPEDLGGAERALASRTPGMRAVWGQTSSSLVARD